MSKAPFMTDFSKMPAYARRITSSPASDMLSPVTPGECTMCEQDGRTVYDIPSVFAELGMYMAEECEE